MTRLLIPAALAAAFVAAPLSAQSQDAAPLSLEHRMLLRCAAGFAIVSHGQDTGNASALAWPRQPEAFREFFVQASARVMRESGLDQQQVAGALQSEAQKLRDEGTLDQIMPVCLDLLPRTVPARQ